MPSHVLQTSDACVPLCQAAGDGLTASWVIPAVYS